MLRISRTLLCLFAVAALATGCAYTRIQRPFDMDFNQTDLGSKEGRSHTYTVLWLVSWGDAGTRAAAEDGDIKVIKHADVEYYSLLFGLYTRVTTVLYGD